MSAKVHVIYDDRGFYFKELGLGMFWVCVGTFNEARKFSTRAAAAAMLKKCGKHRKGWRVLTLSAVPR